MTLLIGGLGLALSGHANGQQTTIEYTSGGLQITLTDLGVLPGGTASDGLALNNQPIIVGLANDADFALQRPLWDANTGVIVGLAENMSSSSTAIPEHMNDFREMAGTEMYGDNIYQGVYWNAAGQAFALPALAGVDPFYGGKHTQAHGINNLGQIVGSAKEAAPNSYTHAVLWPDEGTPAIDLGFLGQGTPLNYSVAHGINDSSHVVGNSNVGTLVRAFLWRNGQMADLGALSGQVVSEAYAINDTGLIAGRSNFYPVSWTYDVANPGSTPTIHQLPIPAGFFDGVPTAVNDSGDVVGYAGAPHIYSHAILWRDGVAIDLGVWPGGHYSVANGINDLGQIVGTGTVAGDNLDHALMWTVDDGASPAWTGLGHGLAGVGGIPHLAGTGALTSGSPGTLVLAGGKPASLAVLFTSLSSSPANFKCGTLVPVPVVMQLASVTNGAGSIPLAWATWPAGLSSASLYLQYAMPDAAAACGVSLSNALRADIP